MLFRLLIALTLLPAAHAQGLRGYIGYQASPPPDKSEFSAGMGFYSAVWPLIDEPLQDFQIGLAGAWIQPDNSDNKDTPLAPEGTLARRWKERGPTWSSVFQTVEGGLGYWRDRRSKGSKNQDSLIPILMRYLSVNNRRLVPGAVSVVPQTNSQSMSPNT